LDLEEMIQNLEGERQRIDEALEVLRRLHRVRKSGAVATPPSDSAEIQRPPAKESGAGPEKK
jgi:hypothetical protein